MSPQGQYTIQYQIQQKLYYSQEDNLQFTVPLPLENKLFTRRSQISLCTNT